MKSILLIRKFALLALLLPAIAYAQSYPSPTFNSLTLQTPLTSANGGTGATAATGTGNVVLSTSPSIASPTFTGSLTFPANSITNASLSQATANTVECNATTSTANIAHCTGFQLADPGPTWTITNIYDSSRTSVNGFPITDELGHNTVGVTQSLVGAVDSPSTSTIEAIGTSGYARSNSVNSAAVGVYGQGTLNASGLQAWGGNFLVTNCPQQICPANSGITADLYGTELDVNVATTSGGGTPAGNVMGLYINGLMNAPVNAMNGIVVDHAGTYPWVDGLVFRKGCCGTAINIGAVATGASQNSQGLQFVSSSSANTFLTATEFEDDVGNLQFIAGPGGSVVLNNNSLSPLLEVGPANITVSSGAAIVPVTTAGIVGTTLADNANAGSDGEFQTNSTTGTSLTSGTFTNCTSVSLTAGDWDVWGQVAFAPAATTTVSAINAGLNTTSATAPSTGKYSVIQTGFTAGQNESIAAPMQRINVSTTTTVYLIGEASFGTSTMTCNGYISARRVR